MEIELLSEFNMVAKHGNLSEAAKELHVTQPVLSKHLKSIESEMGFELFDRSATPMRLTPLGEQFLGYSCRIGTEYERLKAFAQKARASTVQTVSLRGLIDAATLPILRALEERLRENGSGVRYCVAPYSPQTPFDRVRSGDLDLAIEPLSALIDAHGLEHLRLVREQAYVVMEAANPYAARESLCAADLPDMAFTSLRSNRDNAMRKHLQDICRRNGIIGDVPRQLALSAADTYDELFLAGLDGQFLMLPKSLALRYTVSPENGYVTRPFVGDDTEYDICAFHLPNASPAVMTVVRTLQEVVEEHA